MGCIFAMIKKLRSLNPFQMIALTFLMGIVLGTLLLSLPFSAASGVKINTLQALFTATSALCVTGLAVVDTQSSYSTFGQLVILFLIQTGGLGILTFSTAFALLAGKRLGVQDRLMLATQLSVGNSGEVVQVLKRIFLYVLMVELLGTFLLFWHFLPLEGAAKGLYYAVFHSISAFNNAGFALYPDSLIRFAGDAYLNGVISLLIILGGLGFLIQARVFLHVLHPRKYRLDLNSWISLWTPAALIVGGWLLLTLLEWNNSGTLGSLPPADRVLAGFFQSVSPRTAGFNTIDYAQMTHSGLLITIMLMFVGANPGSTGGGIKTTTFFVLITSVWSMVRGRGEMVAFKKRIDQETVLRAGVVAVMALSIIAGAILFLTVTEQRNIQTGKLDFLKVVFEAFSAFCTVGLSMNATPHFSQAGQLILVFLMYVGRIGPLTFAFALSTKSNKGMVHYPADKNIQIG